MDIIRKDKYNIIYNHNNEHIPMDLPVSPHTHLTSVKNEESDMSLEMQSDVDEQLDSDQMAQEQSMIEQQRHIQLRQA